MIWDSAGYDRVVFVLRRVLLVAFATAFCAAPALAAKKPAGNPETDKSLGPADGAGHYFAGQDSPSEFHGCRKSDVQWFPTSLLDGSTTTTPSTHSHVTFTVRTDSLPTFSWTAKPGYRICGVVAFAALANAQSRGGELLAFASYTSGALSGSTAANGKEKIKVRTPKNLADGQPDLKVFAGQTLGIYGFQNITVYVKKR